MCVFVIMLICVCILCYYVYSVKSSWELVFIVYKNRTQIKFSYLIRRCTSQPIKAALITLLRSADIVAGNIDLVISFQSICLCPHYTQRHSVIETMRYSHSLLRLMVKPIVWFVLMARIYQSLILVKLTADWVVHHIHTVRSGKGHGACTLWYVNGAVVG